MINYHLELQYSQTLREPFSRQIVINYHLELQYSQTDVITIRAIR